MKPITTMAFIMSIIGKGLPMLIILFLLSWMIAMNITYYNVIANKEAPKDCIRARANMPRTFLYFT